MLVLCHELVLLHDRTLDSDQDVLNDVPDKLLVSCLRADDEECPPPHMSPSQVKVLSVFISAGSHRPAHLLLLLSDLPQPPSLTRSAVALLPHALSG